MFPVGMNKRETIFYGDNKMDVDLVVSVCHKIKKLDVLGEVKVQHVFGMCKGATRFTGWEENGGATHRPFRCFAPQRPAYYLSATRHAG